MTHSHVNRIEIFHLTFIHFLLFIKKSLLVFRIEYRHSISFRVKIKLLLFEKISLIFCCCQAKSYGVMMGDHSSSNGLGDGHMTHMVTQVQRWKPDFWDFSCPAQPNQRAKPFSNSKKLT